MLKRKIMTVVACACTLAVGAGWRITAAEADTAPASSSADAAAPAAESGTTAADATPVNAKDLFANLKTLVQKYYPRAKLTISDTEMHFEYKCSVQSGYYSSSSNKPTPEAGGIMGNISVEAGDQPGQHKPRLHSHVSYTTMIVTPYSKAQNKHLMVHLYYPPDIDQKFKDRFTELVQNFSEKHAAKVAAAAEEADRKAAAEKEAAEKAAAENAAQDRAIAKAKADQQSSDRAATFGAATMSEMKFPEGRFRVQFPDNYQTLYGNELGQRMVRYAASTPNGTFNVSYLIMPSAPTGADADALFKQVTQATVEGMNGVPAAQAGVASMNGYPGAQTVVQIKGKPEEAAILTVYAGGNYVYVLYAIGKKSWLKSDAVNQFMTSFVCWGQNYNPNAVQYWYGPGGDQYWCTADGVQHWWDARHWEHWRDRSGREHWYDEQHHEHW